MLLQYLLIPSWGSIKSYLILFYSSVFSVLCAFVQSVVKYKALCIAAQPASKAQSPNSATPVLVCLSGYVSHIILHFSEYSFTVLNN